MLIDGLEGKGRGVVAIGRSYADAPEIDGTVKIRGAGVSKLSVGAFADVLITAADTYDLSAQLAPAL